MRKTLLLSLIVIFAIGLFLPRAFAEEEVFDNVHWKNVSNSTIESMCQNKETFIAVIYTENCFNFGLKKIAFQKWMDDYGLDIYANGLGKVPYCMMSGNWELGQSMTSPIIAVVDSGNVSTYGADVSVKYIQKKIQDVFGIYDEEDISFYKMNSSVFSDYCTDSTVIKKLFCKDSMSINADIQKEAQSITKGCTTDLEKLKAIYDWVTENIYYDMGVFENPSGNTDVSAEATYYNKKSVCSGYANLTEALCHSVGIPCRVVSGFAMGMNSDILFDNVWKEYQAYLTTKDITAFRKKAGAFSNHAWNEAFVNGRWIVLDTTWGSNNEYYPSQGIVTGTSNDSYYDMNLESLSATHLFWTDQSENAMLLFGDVNDDGKINGADVYRLFRHVNKQITLTKKQLLAADVTKDTKVNGADVYRLFRYVNKQIGSL